MKQILLTLWVMLIACTAAAQDSYRVKPGDTLRVEVLEDPQLNREVLVLPDGRISFPFAGTISVEGRSVGEIQSAISNGIASNFAIAPSVFVSVLPGLAAPTTTEASGPTIDVYFVGEVNNPGLVQVKRGTTLLQAVAVSGGVTRFAAVKRIQLRRTDPKTRVQRVTILNYKALSKGATTTDIELRDGDVILVPERRLFE